MPVEYENFYENLEEAQRRLTGTVVLYDGEPVYIAQVSNVREDNTFRLWCQKLPNEDLNLGIGDLPEGERPVNSFRKKINSPRFNKFRPFEMGYINLFQTRAGGKLFFPVYLTRTPARRGKQGFNEGSYNCRDNRGGDRRPSFVDIIFSEAFVEMIKGDYPSYREVVARVQDVEEGGIAVDRAFCVCKDRESGIVFLDYRSETVGIARADEILLSDKFSFLRETIVECKNLPNNVNIL